MATSFDTSLQAPQEWLNGLLPMLPGAVADHVKHTLLTVMRDYFSRSEVWTEELASFDTEIGTEDYPLTSAFENADVWTAKFGKMGDFDLLPANRVQSFDAKTNAQAFRTFVCPELGQLRIRPAPSAVLPVAMLVVLVPKALVIPDQLRGEHYDALTSGALARLFMEPKKPYSSPNNASVYARAYELKLSKAKRMHAQGRTQAPVSWRFPRFGR